MSAEKGLIVVSTEDECDEFRAKVLRDICQQLNKVPCPGAFIRVKVQFVT